MTLAKALQAGGVAAHWKTIFIQLKKNKQAVFEHQDEAIPLSYTTSGIYSQKVTKLNYFDKASAITDRPESRIGDITDISDILSYYFGMHEEAIWEEHADIFTDESVAEASLPELAARVMGREIRHIAQRSGKLLARITNLLQTQTKDMAASRMAEIMVQYFKNSVEDNLRLLQYLKKGFEEQPQG